MVRFCFWLVLVAFIAKLASPGYLRFWGAERLSTIHPPDLIQKARSLPFPPVAKSTNQNNSVANKPTCRTPENDLDRILQAQKTGQWCDAARQSTTDTALRDR